MTARACPVCKKPAPAAPGAAHLPFCSRRCADVDLQRWFSGAYVVPGPPVGEDGAEAPGDDDEG